MATPVHVILTGIISLIPTPRQGNVPGYWTVNIPRVSGHHASLVVERGAIRGDIPPNPKCRQYDDGLILAGWWIDKGPLVFSRIEAAEVDTKPIKGLLAIADGCNSADCARALPPDAGVDITFKISDGVIEPAVRDGGTWKFHGMGKKAKRIAEELCWRFYSPDDYLKLEWKDAAGNPITITIEPDAKTKTIELRLANVGYSDMFPEMPLYKANKDDHPIAYFKQSVKPPNPLPPYIQRTMFTFWTPKAVNHDHRLADVVIGVKEVVSDKCEQVAMDEWKVHVLNLRVNCPPVQWNGF